MLSVLGNTEEVSGSLELLWTSFSHLVMEGVASVTGFKTVLFSTLKVQGTGRLRRG